MVGVSWKDRSAILPAGRKADGAYWFSADCGCFITSSYFTETAPGWLESFNARKPADRWAIVAYVRALQLSQAASRADVPPSATIDSN